jgi:hypothetical protein
MTTAQGDLPREQNRQHNRLQKLALGIEESRVFWRAHDPALSPAEENRRAFEQRWFGMKSAERVGVVMADMRARYAAYPQGLAVLSAWTDMPAPVRRLVCHWHLQLADPIYRRFTGGWLAERRESGAAEAGFSAVARWVAAANAKDWTPATTRQVAGKLLSAAGEAGLLGPAPDPRAIEWPTVPEVALAYAFHLLREVRIQGDILDNPYMASVALDPGSLRERLAKTDWIHIRQIGGTREIEWRYPDLRSWAKERLT